MSEFIQYLVKLTISLAVVWLFYQFILRRLTFYNSNRWYLLAYTLLSFFIPFVNISSLFEGRSDGIIQFVPSVHQYTSALEDASDCPAPIWSNYDKWDLIAFCLITVAGLLFLRLVISYFSFLKIRGKATLISKEGIKIYQVNENIIPFSFGNSIFINSGLHTEDELEEIVRHEFVHVKQNHTIDIIWAELLCILNWYNPFAWLLKRSIRQNLEFIADNKVIENGINKKEYQYLLLKVIGNSQFSIATQFNFSSLKKRIVMMNKTKSTKRQLGRFLFLVPVLAVILLSFRHSFKPVSTEDTFIKSGLMDTIPDIKILNSKGYYIDIKDNKGNCMVVIKNKDKKEVKRLLLTEWNENPGYYENLYGEILSPAKVEIEKTLTSSNPEIRTVTVKGNMATVVLKNGKTEVYTLSLSPEKKAFEEICGIKEVAIASTIATDVNVANVANPLTAVNVVNETIAENFEINDKKAVMHLKNGKTEEYDLTNTTERQAFEKKYGRIISPTVSTTTAVNALTAIEEQPENLVVTTAKASSLNAVNVINNDNIISGAEVDVMITIKNTAKTQDLEAAINKFKEKGYDLKFTNKNYNDGILKQLSGTIGNDSSFSFTDFDQATIVVYRQGDKIFYKMYTGKRKVTT